MTHPSAHRSIPIEHWLDSHPALAPACSGLCRCDDPLWLAGGRSADWQPQVRVSSATFKAPKHPIEVKAAELFKRLGIEAVYEPFFFEIGQRPNDGPPRGFQPDFWMPQLGMIIELSARATAKNTKVFIMAEHWPDLPVLVMTDEQIEILSERRDLTAEVFIAYCQDQLIDQAERIAEEGPDPHGYRAGAQQLSAS